MFICRKHYDGSTTRLSMTLTMLQAKYQFKQSNVHTVSALQEEAVHVHRLLSLRN